MTMHREFVPKLRLRGRLFAVVAATALAAGCHVPQPYEPTPPAAAAEALEVVKALPSFEDTKAQVQAAMNEITTAAARLVPGIHWETFDEGSGSGCLRPYEQTGGQGYLLPDQVAVRAPLSEPQWEQLQATAKAVAAKLEATEVQVMQDQPGNHDVGFYGPTGLFIKIGYRGNLVVSGFTGCRLPRDKK